MFVSEQCSICGEGYSLSTSKPENTGHESEETPAISSSGTRTGDVTRQLSYGHNNRSPFSIPRSFNIRKQTRWSSSPMISSGSYLLLFVFLMLCMQFHCQGTVQGLSLPEPKSLPMHRISSKDPVSLYTEQDSTNISYKQPTRKTSNDLYMDPCKAAGFINDIALTDDDVHDLMKMWHNNIEVQVDDPNVRHPRKISEPVSKRRPRKKKTKGLTEKEKGVVKRTQNVTKGKVKIQQRKIAPNKNQCLKHHEVGEHDEQQQHDRIDFGNMELYHTRLKPTLVVLIKLCSG